jgi:hypothetical protein
MQVFLALALAGSAGFVPWWQGLGMSETEVRGLLVNEQGVAELVERLRGADLDDLMDRCAGIVDAGRTASGFSSPIPEGRYVPAFRGQGQPHRTSWLICIAAFQLVADAGETRFEDQIALLHQAIPGALGDSAEMVRRGGFYLPHELHRAAARAYYELFLSDMSVTELVDEWRTMNLLRDPAPPRRVRIYVRAAAISLAFGDLIDGPWPAELLALYHDTDARVRQTMLLRVARPPPEARDRAVALLLDPNPAVRQLAEDRLLGAPERTPEMALPLLRFLSRPDLDERAYQVAVEALRVRGYAVESGPTGLRAVPLRPGIPPLELPAE